MYLGIDVGSVSTDAALVDDKGALIAHSIVRSGFDHKLAIQEVINSVCHKAGINYSQIKKIVGTGYGRRNVPHTCKVVTEISCHAMGIHLLYPMVRTVIDIGGQDSKVIHVTENGYVENFVMNDKCAAGTGRFLEVMAHAMGVHVQELGLLCVKAKKAQPISSICTVFAESEVISKVAEGKPIEEIIAGIHKAIGERLMGMVNTIGYKKPIAITGGVAKNIGLVKTIASYFNNSVIIPTEPQIIGALGAAIYALKHKD